MSTQIQATRRLIIDGLNCAALTREQMERTRAGGVVALNLTIIRPWSDFTASMQELAQKLEAIAELDDLVTVATSAVDIERARDSNRVAIILGAQNTTLVEQDLGLLRILQRLGFRILQPTYNEPNLFGDGATVDQDRGLSELGREWVATMNRLQMVIDISHCGYRTSGDVIAASDAPVIFSHANARALCDSPRNKPDELIRAIAEKGGITGAVCWAPALKHAIRPTLDDYLDQVAYIVNLAGIDHVSFASDMAEGVYGSAQEWDGKFGPNGMYPTVTGVLGDWYTFDQRFPAGFESLAHVERVWDGLVKRGYGGDVVEKIMGGNLLRVFREVWGA